MSYDLKIYTVKKQNYANLLEKFEGVISGASFVFPFKKSQIFVSEETEIEEEDIPTEICRALSGIQYLIECNLEPVTASKKDISELLKIAKMIAQNGYGVIENPQTDEIILPTGIKRSVAIEKTERLSTVELSWWFDNDSLNKHEMVFRILNEIERTMPEALPRRYGLYEPPKEKYNGKDNFIKFLEENADDSIVWYPTKPVIYVSLAIPSIIGPTRLGYRFGHFSIEIDAAVLEMDGWKTSINRLFKNISQIVNPFYGDIRIINNYIRSRTGTWSDGETEAHPIAGWWWNGIPRKSGFGLVIGRPLLDYVSIMCDYELLSNGCKLFNGKNADPYYGIKFDKEIFQPEAKKTVGCSVIGFSGLYPKKWPFKGPKQGE